MNSTQEISTQEIDIIIVLPNREEIIIININDNITQTITDYYEFDYIDIYYEDTFIEYGLSPSDCCMVNLYRITVNNVGRIKTKEQIIEFIKELSDIKFEEEYLNQLFDGDLEYYLNNVYDYIINLIFYKSTIKILPYSVGRLDIQSNLEFFNNQLESLPENFCRIKVGGNLYLFNNKLTSLPESFGRLKIRGTLNLCNNKINELPESFAQLKIGGNLNLSGNKLKSLTENFGKIEIEYDLNLSDNQINELPKSFLQLKISGDLDLSGNKLTSLPEFFPKIGGDVHLFYNKLIAINYKQVCNSSDEDDE